MLFSVFLILGLIISQIIPADGIVKTVSNTMLYICLGYIMINVGREFELNKSQWKSYAGDYFIAMATAAMPWVLIALYYIFILLPPEYWGSWEAWKENLLLSRFAAPTSAGILFTMLAALGLKSSWMYKKIQVLAIFDDLDTILLMIPLQIMMIGLRWQLIVIILIVFVLLTIGWKYLSRFTFRQDWKAILAYATIVFIVCQGLYLITKHFYGDEGSIHIEVLLPAFVLGMIMKHQDSHSPIEEKVSTGISFLFMFLVGVAMPHFVGVNFAEAHSGSLSITGEQPMMPWVVIIFHVIIVSILSNIGKLCPVFFYRDRKISERLALSIGMFTRGEVGAGVIFIALGYNLGGPALIISVLTIVLNLILTGIFVMWVKNLALRTYKES